MFERFKVQIRYNIAIKEPIVEQKDVTFVKKTMATIPVGVHVKKLFDSNKRHIGVIHTANFNMPLTPYQKKYVESYLIQNLFTQYPNTSFTLYSEIHSDWAKIVGIWGENEMPDEQGFTINIPA